jgi:hypothetical protein
MMYEICGPGSLSNDLEEALSAGSRNSNLIRSAENLKTKSFENDILEKLLRSANNKGNFKRHLHALLEKGLIGLDDYSLAIMGD